MNKNKERSPLVYVPDGAKINKDNKKMDAPPVEYEKRKAVFPREEVKKNVTKKDTP